MTNRPTRFLRAACTGLVTCASIALIPLSAEGAPTECLLAKPKTAAPPGQYWLHLSDWLSKRQCWVLRARIEPAQSKGSASAQAARAAARTATATPARATEEAAANALPTRADLAAPPRTKDDGGRDASGTSTPPGVSERADPNPWNVAPPMDARPPPAARAPEAPTALSLASEQPPTAAFAAQTFATQTSPAQTLPAQTSAQAQKTNRRASIEAAPESVALTETAMEARAIGAPTSLQMLLLAVFCGPALYLFAAGTIRRLRPAEAAHGSLPYVISLDDASANRALLAPRLESKENVTPS
jgi:hypothetical protein